MFLASVFLFPGPDDAILVRQIGYLPIAVLLLFAVASGALYWRRRYPAVVLAVALAAWALTLGQEYSNIGGVTLIALYATGRYASSARWGQAGVAAAITLLVGDNILGSLPWGESAFGSVVMFGVWYVGRRLRLGAERAAELVREQAAEARRIVVEERTRIARELHDVVAHRVSMMTVQAGAARAVAAEDPARAMQAMGAVEEAGRQALDELRHLLGVLRPEADADALGPQPGLADLPALIEQTRVAGLDVSLVMDGLLRELPTRVELSAYRIVQESLTNVLKHAGPGTRTEVRLRADTACIFIEVTDEGRGVSTLPGSGHGTVGMRERALLLGGSLDAGPRPGGGFRVFAQLPMGGEPR
jgi:signal transduction histidine kinase